ncbi:hypothetical protein FJU08_02970 [Martelella alba]|uniref:Uncharacterized protein n=1 Tax=Martelella alba TaxID=2590451 RepID=A0A506UJU9_9HYPH|nr:hypothetical protein [Martelella alba]TPW33533.1 hypothetical protein FJU08_02970 [Martelella alba]
MNAWRKSALLGIALLLSNAMTASAQTAGNAFADEAAAAQRQGEPLAGLLSSSPDVAGAQLRSLAEAAPNRYVLLLQQFLSAEGFYSGTASTILDVPTIRALFSFCDRAGIGAACLNGPLLPATAEALGKAIVAAPGQAASALTGMTPAAPTRKESAEPPRTESMSSRAPEDPAADWLGQSGNQDGITFKASRPDKQEIRFHLNGTASRSGVGTLYLAGRTDNPAQKGETWQLQARITLDDTDGPQRWLITQMSLFDKNGRFIAPLDQDAFTLSPGKPSADIDLKGTISQENAAFIRTMIGFSYGEGEAINLDFSIQTPGIEKTDAAGN